MNVTITYDDTLYQLVPKVGTGEMLSHVCDCRKDHQNSADGYAQLLSAAPTPPAQPKLPPGFHSCTFSNDPVKIGFLISGESAQTSAQPAEQPPIPESLWRSILDAGLTLHKDGDKWWVEKAQPAERKPQAGAGTRAVWPEKVANTVLDTPEPDEWIDGEPRPLPVFHMATLMKYGERCAEAGMSTITPDVNITFLAKADQANTKSAMKQAVERFLGWRLPQDFAPDCGISFDGRKDDEWNKNKTWPTGTNLFTAEQAKQMLEYVLSAIPTAEPAEKRLLTREQLKAVAICLESGRVSISEVQRKMGISWLAANELCQSIVDAGLVNGLELSPQLLAHGIKG